MKKYICESCNKDFNAPNKINKFFAIIGLLIIYTILSFLIIPLSWLIGIIGLCHIIKR